jgi:large subunit ribosomal protein L14e
MLDVGRVCLKTAGREAGRYCVIVKNVDENFVLVTGPRELTSVKRRRCNINHLEPLMDALNIKSDAPDSEVLKAYQKANLITKLGLGLGPGKAKPSGKAEPRKAEKGEKVKEIRKGKKPEKKEKPEKKAKKEKAKKEKKPSKKASPKKKAKK